MSNNKLSPEVEEKKNDTNNNIKIIQVEFKCVSCKNRFRDVRLLKSHFWQVHITKDEFELANEKLASILVNGNDCHATETVNGHAENNEATVATDLVEPSSKRRKKTTPKSLNIRQKLTQPKKNNNVPNNSHSLSFDDECGEKNIQVEVDQKLMKKLKVKS